MTIRYISQKLAQQVHILPKEVSTADRAQIDEELMSASGAFSLDQLMELAGLACAQGLAKSFPQKSHRRVMVCCGPGNQGGDGLVAARHLHMFRYTPTVYLPKPGPKDIYQRLLKQVENLKIPVINSTEEFEKSLKEHDVIMDAVFGVYHHLAKTSLMVIGFSFHPPVRAPFDRILRLMKSSSLPIISIDIPSGWSVSDGPQPLYTEADENGETETVETFDPEVLVSLTAPKEGVRGFKGRHWLGGRFVPDEMAKRLELNLPEYEGIDQVIELPRVKGHL